ncbi:MAG: aminoacyl-tRNA hydrolase [Neomegalonema sp.]|nr:aminoacyl-tRNA hydrolase [Neomegalonema sp.]
MKLFVGLGNPGAKYEKTRHNIGFLAIDAIARAHGFSAERTKFQAAMLEGKLGTEKVIALKPMTFMNLSGQSIGEAMRFFKLEPADVVVFHDELDLPPGRMKVKTGGGHAGHNGLRSTHEHIGPAFVRVRLGIGHPGDKRLVSNYVLHDFAKADWAWIEPLLDAVADAAPALAKEDAAGFMNKVALKLQPPKDAAKPTPKKSESDARPGDAASAKSGKPEEAPAPSPFDALKALMKKK